MKKIRYINLDLKKTLPLLLTLFMVILSGCALTIEEYKARANQNFSQGRYDEAIRDANAVIRQSPTDASSWKILGISHIKKGQFDEAVVALKKATELKTTRTEADNAFLDACAGHALFKQGNIASAAEKFKSAEPFFDRLLGREGSVNVFFAYLYKTYGNVLEKTGKTETALKMYRKASGLGGADTAETIKRLVTQLELKDVLEKARIAEQNSKLRKAFEHYKIAFAVASREGLDTREIQEKTIKLALRLDPPPAVPKEAIRHAMRAEALLEIAKGKSEYWKAFDEYKKALIIAPWWADAYFNYALAQEAAEYYEEAIRSYKLFVLAAPNDPAAKEVENKMFKLEVKAEDGMKFVLIPNGSFMMGSPSNEPGRENNERQHRVTISKPFYMQTTEVTQGQWRKVMGNNPSRFKNCGDDCPVEKVSWNDAQKFIRELNQREGANKYRLPTEAEWEYACRAGTTTRFCFGDSDGQLDEYAWYDTNSSKTHSVGQKKPNAWGLYDMHGNVWEWCQNWKGDYPSGHVTDPTGPSSGSRRVRRGGGWYNYAGGWRSANRDSLPAGYRGSTLGFRLARTL